MPRTLDAVADHRSFVQRRAAVGAAVADGGEPAVAGQQQDRGVLDGDGMGHTLDQLVFGADVGPVHRRPLERRGVDPDALGVRQMPTQPSRHTEQAKAGHGQRLATAVVAAGEPGCTVEAETDDVQQRVSDSHPAFGSPRVSPVGHPRCGGRDRREQSEADEPTRGGRIAAGQVENCGAGERADRDRDKRRMQRMAERRTREHILGRPGSQPTGQLLSDFGGPVQHLGVFDGICEPFQ
ncbi:MAG: hypothetical protein WKF83_12585 [Nocardioidaceae bacterium]